MVLALRRILRTGRLHAHRGTFLVDAQVVRAAFQKGRSSAPTLRLVTAQAGALCLVGDLRLRFGYLPSESNPADAPSRGSGPRERVRRVPGRCTPPPRRADDRLRGGRWSARARNAGSDSDLTDSSGYARSFLWRNGL